MINTRYETRNLRNPQRHESQNTQHRYSHVPTDIVTIMDSPMETKWHIYIYFAVCLGIRNDSTTYKVAVFNAFGARILWNPYVYFI